MRSRTLHSLVLLFSLLEVARGLVCPARIPQSVLMAPGARKLSNRATPVVGSPVRLGMSNQFDVSKPVFDILTLRNIRGDALLRYNSLNQSEPLRISLYALLSLSLFAFPFVSETVGGEPVTGTGIAESVLGTIGSIGLFLRECDKRSKQLIRIEKELNSESLQLRLPMNAISDVPFTDAAPFGTLMKTSTPPRIIAICGTSEELTDALTELKVYGRRLRQATTFVVPVPTDGSNRDNWDLGDERLAWLADAYDVDSWVEYFDGLDDTNVFRWFGLNSNGRSFGSGSGNAPQWLQIFGQYCRPTALLSEEDRDLADSVCESVLASQRTFYQALTSGDLDEMNKIYWRQESAMVTEVIEAGGRIDSWVTCLEEGARPSGMSVSGSDAIVISDTEAWSTAIEFPTNTGVESATLLAVQQWTREPGKDAWSLQLHQTIPWTSENRAQGTLRCDCRGCVALTREPERRTFGGAIG